MSRVADRVLPLYASVRNIETAPAIRLAVATLSFAMGIALPSVLCSAVFAQSYVMGEGAFAIPSGPTTVVSADFNGDGRIDLAVTTGSGIAVLLGKPDGSFAPEVSYPVAGSQFAVGDVNGDGKLDLIAIGGYQPTIWILLGNGDGSFQAATSTPLGNGIEPTGIAAADLNRDGKLDLAIAGGEYSGAVVAILLGNGNGTFGAQVDYASGASSSIITADFNRDGNPDLALGNGYSGGGGDAISILLGNGDGTFKPYSLVPIPGDGQDYLAAADLNDDGKIDLVVASFYNSLGGVSVLLGNGDGTFGSAVSYPDPIFGGFSNAVAIGDFNGDGRPDIACTNYDGNDLSVFLGVGDGTFKSGVNYPASVNPVGLVTADFNGDGHQDIASIAGYGESAAASVLIGEGDGTFSNYVNHAIPIYPYNIAAGDFNGDGNLDLVVDSFNSPGSVSILLGAGNGSFSLHTDAKAGNHPSFFTTGDFNGDGKLDVVVSATDPKTGALLLLTLLGNGNGTLQAPLSQTLKSIPNSFAVADFNLDGKLDLATSLQLTTGVSIFFAQGDGTFSSPSLFDDGNSANSPGGPVFSADLNGDKRPDLLASTSNGISILLGEGNGSFQPYHAILPGYSLLGVGDFNGDGKQDLVVFSPSPTGVAIALGKGDGTFKIPKNVYVLEDLTSSPSVLGDFNGDGKLDFAFISSYSTVSVLLGNNDGTFGERVDYETPSGPWSLTAGDFRNNGGLDLVVGAVATGSSSVASVYLSRPVGALYPSALQFGSQAVGTASNALTTTLYNSGGAPLTISSITITAEFSQTNNCGVSLPVGSSCVVKVIFEPTTLGKEVGRLTVKDSATVKPQTIELSGIGVK